MTEMNHDEQTASPRPPFLRGVRVLELADELGEYCGKLLAGLGADVLKVEPRGGEATRQYGPFYHDETDINRSLYFWHYNHGKKSVVMDLDDPLQVEMFAKLAASADIILDTRPAGYLDSRQIGFDKLRAANPGLIYARISHFGDDGPWSGYLGSDLVHLALGGVMMNCGYDPEPSGHYDVAPIAPQMWQSYQIAGEMAAMGIIAALIHRLASGTGQALSTSVHEAVSANTETDMPDWVFLRQEHHRLTCRHSMPEVNGAALAATKDGRFLLPYRTYFRPAASEFPKTVRLLKKFNMQADLEDEKYQDPKYLESVASTMHIANVVDVLVGKFKYERELWRDAQADGMAWAPIVRPEEHVGNEHWRMRGAIVDVEYPELGESFASIGAKWYSADTPWAATTRAPLLGEHTNEILSELDETTRAPSSGVAPDRRAQKPSPTRHVQGKPFALDGVRVLDLSWLLASGGAGRFLAAFGAEVIKVEHESHCDYSRWSKGACPPGGREQRARATAPIKPMGDRAGNPNLGGSFMEINAGKQSVSLNLKHPRGKELLTRLIELSDVIVEGFSPGTMKRMGFGYERLREINPKIVYVSQSGLGEYGTAGDIRTFGPSAQGFAGLSEMSGLPEPYPPAGIGYSYLDWFGAYNMANAVLAALYRRRATGEGAHIDASQVETGMYLSGTAILDYSVNHRRWKRYGNRSPYKPAAPHGAYRTTGDDRWIAISCFDDSQWKGLAQVLGLDEDARFATLEDRLIEHDALDHAVDELTNGWDPFELMERLQSAGVPAGVCQTAQDRYETDPQLAHLEWMVELPQSEIGTWPVKDVPVDLTETPARIGGPLGRSGPNYGEDTERVLQEVLQLDAEDIAGLRKEGVL
jgi:crotonobetainyl-CoA:carnitine CoA-transferase CaiB-like acyl-CoA transferase